MSESVKEKAKEIMGFDESDVDGGGGGGGKSVSPSDVSCSICLDPVTDNGDRSRAKLRCGHEFHLDCIGSAFNVKGAMQCPNCRKIEKGQWLFATGCNPFADISFEDWSHDEDLYDIGYSEMPFGLQWCPITAFPRLSSSFEDGEFPSTAYHDLQGQHAIFAEHAAVPSSTHPCPYVAYYGPVHSSSSSSVGSVSDGSNFSSHWSVPSESSEMPTYAFAAMDPHYPNWEHHSLPFSAHGSHLGGPDQPSLPPVTQRSSQPNSDLPRSGSFVPPPIASQSPGARFASSAPPLMSPPYPGSAARARDRAQALQAYFQPPSTSPPPPMHPPVPPTTRRSNSQRGGLPPVGPLLTSSDQTAGFCVFPTATSSQNYPEAENQRFRTRDRDCPVNFRMNPLERDSGWRTSHAPASGSGSWRQRRGSSNSRS